jgi:hypothetical protein
MMAEMRASDRISLIDKLGRALQSRFGYREIDTFLGHYKIATPREVTTNSKWVYSKEALRDVEEATLLRIAEELDVEVPTSPKLAERKPRNWSNTSDLRLFISHLAGHKDKATRLKRCLALYAINGFVAHEDIVPTLEWQAEIERALHAMDAFIAIHTAGFEKRVDPTRDRLCVCAWREDHIVEDGRGSHRVHFETTSTVAGRQIRGRNCRRGRYNFSRRRAHVR